MVYLWIVICTLPILINSKMYIEQPCYDFDKSLPIPLRAYQIGHFQYNGSNKVFLFGGRTWSILGGYRDKSSIYKWDLQDQNGWFTEISSSTTSTFYSLNQNAVVIGHKAYFIGVYDGATQADNGYIYTFDMITETFSNGYNIGLTRPKYRVVYGCLTTNNTHIFMISGKGGGEYHAYTQIYDVNLNIWYDEPITLVPLKFGWNKQLCFFIDDTLFAFGGFVNNDTFGNNGIINHYYKYTWTDKWIYLGQKPFHSYQGSIVYYKSYIYIIGGYPTTNIIDIFDTETETLITNSSYQYFLVESVDSMASIINNDKIYVFGGTDVNDDVLSTVQICNINNIATISPTTSNPSTFTPTTLNPTTFAPTTITSTTMITTTLNPTTSTPTTLNPSTFTPTTLNPTTSAPTNSDPLTLTPSFDPTTGATLMNDSIVQQKMVNESVTTTQVDIDINKAGSESAKKIDSWIYFGVAAILLITGFILCILKYKKMKKSESINDINVITKAIGDIELAQKQTQSKMHNNNANINDSYDRFDTSPTYTGCIKEDMCNNDLDLEDMYNNDNNDENMTVEGQPTDNYTKNETIQYDKQLTPGSV